VSGSAQPPASTWKLAVAAMALETGAITPEEYMPIACTGGMSYGGRYWKCWEPGGHGRQNLILGIQNSCDVYFYQVGLRIGLDRFIETGVRNGFDRRTGVDLPSEYRPDFPADREYWDSVFGYSARESEVLSMAIGQGPITMTALKLAEIYSALTSPDGRAPAPRFAHGAGAAPDTFELHLSDENVWYLEAGMRRVLGPAGTARLSRLRDWELMGKTGTAQNTLGADHAWFVGVGSVPGTGKPEIVVAAYLQGAEHGYLASGYVAEAVNFYMDRKYGHPFQGWATPRFRAPRGLRINWDWTAPVVDPPFPGGGIPAGVPGSATSPRADSTLIAPGNPVSDPTAPPDTTRR
jgi:penicillin-binding protein 2